MENPLVDQEYCLQKFPGKGGWTFAEIPEVLPDKKAPFGWVKVKGTIDGYSFGNYRLQPMGNQRLFLPVKADIRKKIGKQAGDWVRVILFPDDSVPEIPEEIVDCLKQEEKAYAAFLQLGEGKQREYLDWIYAAKKDETRANRIVVLIRQMLQRSSSPKVEEPN